jgi:SAM-dependent methyltransferase
VAGEGWTWDESLYAGSAAFYAAGRMPYPPELVEAMRELLALDGHGRLLDVGCGPGSLTLLLAPLFEQAIGVDADADMIAEAREQAGRAQLNNVSWRHLRAEQLPGDLGTFRVVTFAQSFHWVDRPAVAATIRRMLEADGACVLVYATTHQGVDEDALLPHPHSRPPRDEIGALVARYLGPVRRAGRGLLPHGPADREDLVMREAGFVDTTLVEVGGGTVMERTADEVVASVYSLSSSTPHLFGDRLDAFDSELRELLAATSPNSLFSEQRREVAVQIWRPEWS